MHARTFILRSTAALLLIIAGILAIYSFKHASSISRQREVSLLKENSPHFGSPEFRSLNDRPETAALTVITSTRALVGRWQIETNDMQKLRLEQQLCALLTDASAAMLVRELSPDLLENPLAELALQRWASLDRRAAGDWMAALPHATELQAGYIMYGWFKEDPTSMRAYIDSLQIGPWRESVIKTSANDTLLAKDGVATIDLLQRLPPQPERNEMLGWATTEWARQHPVAASEWALTVPDLLLQEKLLGAAAVGAAWSDPKTAVKIMAQGLIPGENFNRTLESIVHIWAASTPVDAANWIRASAETLPPEIAARSLVNAWAPHEPTAVQSWIAQLPPGPLRRESEHQFRLIEARLRGVDISENSTDQEIEVALESVIPRS